MPPPLIPGIVFCQDNSISELLLFGKYWWRLLLWRFYKYQCSSATWNIKLALLSFLKTIITPIWNINHYNGATNHRNDDENYSPQPPLGAIFARQAVKYWSLVTWWKIASNYHISGLEPTASRRQYSRHCAKPFAINSLSMTILWAK